MRIEEIKEGRIYVGGKLNRARQVSYIGLATEVPGIGVLWFTYNRLLHNMTEECAACSLASFARWAKRRFRED